MQNGFAVNFSDSCVYLKMIGSDCALICLYVDDMLIFGTNMLVVNVMPQPLLVAGLTNNDFKDRRLALQIITSLFGVLHPRSHAVRETSQGATHLKIAPQQARLTMEFLRVGFPKRRCTFGDLSSQVDPFKPHSGY